MKPLTLKFKLKSLEAEYELSKQNYNIYGFHVIFTFNVIILLIICLLALLNQSLIQFFYSIVAIILILICYPLMRVPSFRLRFGDIIIIYLILLPYFIGVYFFAGAIHTGMEGFAGGFVFNMFLSFPIRIRMNWYKKLLIHVPAYIFVEVLYYIQDQEISFAFVGMLTIMFLNLLFDFYQDKMERKNFLIEHHFKKNNEVFEHLFKNIIPEEILIWKSSGIDFANKSALDLFQVNTKDELEPLLLKSIEIQEIETTDTFLINGGLPFKENTKTPFNHYSSENCTFLKKITEILNSDTLKETNFISFTAKITVPSMKKINLQLKKPTYFGDFTFSSIKRQEYDIKMKRFFWDEQESVLVILNAVEEKNLKSRLEFVNSYLNYLLANLSHEIYTPLNGLLGMLEVSINSLTDNPVIQQNLMVARNSADFLLTITQDLFDFYNIRRGCLVVNISKISIMIYVRELLLMFSTYFQKDNLSIENTLESQIIHSDPQKLKQILVGIVNHIMNSIYNAKISVILKPSLQKENILIEINASGAAINPMKFSERLGSHTPLKVSKRLAYDRKFGYNDRQIYNDVSHNGGGNLELHLIRYLALSLAPDIDVPFQRKERKIEDSGVKLEFFYQIFLSDIRENKTILIEDISEDKVAFEADYRMDYSELFENSESAFPSLELKVEGSEVKPKSPEKLLRQMMNHSLEDLDRDNLKDVKESTIPQIESLKSPLYTHLDGQDMNSSVFDERRSEETTLKSTMDRHRTLKRPSFSLNMPKFYRKSHSNEQMFSEMSGESPELQSKPKTPIILNVDDNPINLMVITNYCRFKVFRVIEASNGLDALEKTKKLYQDEELTVDMVFMDCDMPVMDGFKSCEQILKFYNEKIGKGPPIVAITANDTYEDRMKAKNCGMRELVKKPLSKNKFEELIAYWMLKKT